MSHTPGPWSVEEAYGNAGLAFHEILAGGKTLASTWPGPNEANARLIAAAPQLAEACHLLLDALNDPGVGDHEQWKRDCKTATLKGRAALRAAGLA